MLRIGCDNPRMIRIYYYNPWIIQFDRDNLRIIQISCRIFQIDCDNPRMIQIYCCSPWRIQFECENPRMIQFDCDNPRINRFCNNRQKIKIDCNNPLMIRIDCINPNWFTQRSDWLGRWFGFTVIIRGKFESIATIRVTAHDSDWLTHYSICVGLRCSRERSLFWLVQKINKLHLPP